MATIANLAVLLSANTAAFTEKMNGAAKVIDNVQNKAATAFGRSAGISSRWGQTFADEAKTASKAANSFTNQLFQVGQRVEWTQTRIVRMFRGSGAAIALLYAAHLVNKVLDETAATMQKVHANELSMADGMQEVYLSIAQTIPIAGNWLEVGRRIRTMYEGTMTAMQDFETMQKKVQESQERAAKISYMQVEAIKSSQDAIRNFNREADFLANPKAKAELQAGFDFEDAMKQVDELKAKLANIPIQKGWLGQDIFDQGRADLEASITKLEGAAIRFRDLKLLEASHARVTEETKFIQDLVMRFETFGKTPAELMFERIAKVLGPEALAFVERYSEQLRNLESNKAIEETLKGLQDQLDIAGLSPVQELMVKMKGATIEQIEKAMELRTAIDDITAATERRKDAEDQLVDNMDFKPFAARVFRFTAGVPGNISSTNNIPQQQLAEAKKQTSVLTNIEKQTQIENITFNILDLAGI